MLERLAQPQTPPLPEHLPIPGGEVHVDPDSHTPLARQILDDAAHRGRLDMVGLAWQEGNLSCEISQATTLDQAHGVHDGKTTLPRPEINTKPLPKRLARKFRHRDHIKGGPALARQDRYTLQREQTKVWSIDVRNAAGELVEVREVRGQDDLENYFNASYEHPHHHEWHDPLHVHVPTPWDPRRKTDRPVGASPVDPQKKVHRPTGKNPMHFQWREEAPHATGHTVEIPVHSEHPIPTMHEIFEQQERMNLEGLTGLTWTDADGHRKQVVRDMTLPVAIKYDRTGKTKPVRHFIVETRHRDTGAPIAQHTYAGEARDGHHGLAEHFKSLESSMNVRGGPDTTTNIHWELPATDAGNEHTILMHEEMERLDNANKLQPHHMAHLGFLATEAAMVPREEANDSPTLSRDESFMLLSYPDIDDGKSWEPFVEYNRNNPQWLPAEEPLEDIYKVMRKTGVESVLKNPSDIKFAEALRESMQELGAYVVLDRAEDMVQQQQKLLNELGVDPPEKQKSISWALLELAKQYHYANNPNEKNPALEGLTEGDAFAATEEGLRIRRELVDLKMFDVITALGIEARPAKIQVPGKDGKPHKKDIEVYSPRQSFVVNLQPFVRWRAEQLLKKRETSEDEPLTPSEKVELSRLVSRGLNH